VICNDGLTHAAGYLITGCTFSGNGGFRGHTSNLPNGVWQNIHIINNVFTGWASHGCLVGGSTTGKNTLSNVVIEYNEAKNITGINGGGTQWCAGVGIQIVGAGAQVAPNYIQYNHIHNLGANAANSSGGGPGGAFMSHSDSVIMRYNVVHDIRGDPVGGDGAGLDIDIDNSACQILRNVVYNCDGGGIYIISNSGAGGTHVIAWNVAVNCGRTNEGGCWVGAIDGCQIFNNTIIQQTGTMPALACQNTITSANKKVYNNILVSLAGTPSANWPTFSSGVALDYNAYLSGASSFSCTYNSINQTTLAGWKTATGQDAHAIALTGNPCAAPSPVPGITPGTISLAVVYRLLYGNVCFAAGADLLSLYSINPGTTDCIGNPIPVPYSIGAINSQVLLSVVGRGALAANWMVGGCVG